MEMGDGDGRVVGDLDLDAELGLGWQVCEQDGVLAEDVE